MVVRYIKVTDRVHTRQILVEERLEGSLRLSHQGRPLKYMETVEKQKPFFHRSHSFYNNRYFLNLKPDISTLVKSGHFYFG